MNIENYIESQYRELLSCSQINVEYSDLYKSFRNQKLREILMTLHHDLVGLFRTMNERLPTGEHEAHFWAEPSRDLIKRIEIIFSLVSSLKATPLAFQIDPYYLELLTRCRDFLSSSGGSSLPPNMAKVELYYTLPIFLPLSSITISHKQQDFTFDLKLIGSGSYANVYKYKDTFYNRPFILKRAKKELTDKEMARFKREFDVMNDLSSPYILEVYCYNPDKNEYIMEYMDYTLDGYIAAHNSTLTIIQRKGIAQQILRAFDYLHSKGHLHRDISPKNILGNTAQFASGISLNSNSREKHGSPCSLIRESIRLQAVRQGLSARSRSANANIILHLARCFSSPRYRVLRKRSCFLTTPNTCSTFARTEDFACSAFFASYWPLLLSFLI